MIGEIRDLETAQIAVQAIDLTGHLVLSTLHTNTAVGAVTRDCRTWASNPSCFPRASSAQVAARLVRVLDPDNPRGLQGVGERTSERLLNLRKDDEAPTSVPAGTGQQRLPAAAASIGELGDEVR